MGGSGKYNGTALAAACVMLGIVAVLVLGLVVFHGLDANSTPLVVSLIAIVSAATPTLIMSAKIDQTVHRIENGLLPTKVKEALRDPEAQHAIHDAVHNGNGKDEPDGRPSV